MERIRPDDMPQLPRANQSQSGATISNETTLADACPGCNGAGYYTLRVPYGHPDFGKLQRCECQAGTPLPSHVRMLAQLRGDLGHLAECTFATFRIDRKVQPFVWDFDGARHDEETQQTDLHGAYWKAFEYAAALDGWLYLFGTFGAGKSHLAAAVANKAASRGIATTYASVPKLLDFIRAGYKDGSASERVDTLSNVPLLVLDDLGAEAGKKDTDELLFALFNHRSRERANLPTVITSNVHPDHLEPRIGDRVYGQTDGGARIVWMPIYSYRRLRP